ncbi:nucleotidyltransferase family protein [Haloferula sp. A504]|uniref:nucleotidyltransferase family protein n=1 Tax=Haloferula sp. A504 TaxID=3373601 RepID=UPI0031BFCD29|nr:nucleotidyltransferase domain-containing protein [Verrucomicrobiaceae bacterium E54]
MKTRDSLISSIRSLSQELEPFGVSGLWLFGSVARGEDNSRDLDFLVEFSSPPTLNRFMGLKFFLEDRLRMPVDLHTRSSCPERFMRRILPELLHVA